MRFTNLIVQGLAVVLGLGLLTAGLPQQTVRADELDDSIAEMLKTGKSTKEGKEGDVLKLINKVNESPDSRATAAITKLAKSKNDKVAAAAYRAAGKRKSEDLVKTLKTVLAKGGKKLKDRKPVLLAALDAAANYGEPKLRDALKDVVKKHLSTDSAVSTRAIAAFGSERHVEVLEQLFKWMDVVGASGSGGQGKSMSTETRAFYETAARAIYDVLGDLTGQDIADPQTWKDWWSEQDQKKYEFPDPNAVEAAVEWDKITEWLDPGYKYKVTLPSGEGWKFAVPDQWCRARVVWTATGGEEYARVDFQIHNTTTAPQKSVKALMDWWLNDWKTNQFSEIRGDDPEPSKIKIGGREFMMARAIGVSGGNVSGWGNAERRIYMTKIKHLILYMALTTKLGLEEDVHQAWVDVAEKLEFVD